MMHKISKVQFIGEIAVRRNLKTYDQPHIFLRKPRKQHYKGQLGFAWLDEQTFIKLKKESLRCTVLAD
jgi:hypothetical protein